MVGPQRKNHAQMVTNRQVTCRVRTIRQPGKSCAGIQGASPGDIPSQPVPNVIVNFFLRRINANRFYTLMARKWFPKMLLQDTTGPRTASGPKAAGIPSERPRKEGPQVP